MRLVGFTVPGEAGRKVGLLEGAGVVPLASVEDFWADARAVIAAAATMRGARSASSAIPLDSLELVPPVLPDARVICVGLNYRAHIEEGSYRDEEEPAHPTLFARWTRSLTAGDRPAPVPPDEDGLDWEGEVAAYVGSDLAQVDADTARAAVIGYSTFNDLTSRRAQKLTSQWTIGKNGDESGPLGPLVTVDEVGDLRDGLLVRTRVNGETVQEGSTRDMIFEVGEVLSGISRTLTLRAGDILCTGTPDGVGYARTPPWLLHAGDVVEVEVERLGILTTPIVDHPSTAEETP